MTNVYGPGKLEMRSRLLEIGDEVLETQGWKILDRRWGVRDVVKGNKKLKVCVRTTQDCYLAFPRGADNKWVTLSEVDAVLIVSVDDAHKPKFALVHWVDGDEMRSRYDRAYKARIAAGYSIPVNRGLWLSLYDEENKSSPVLVGAGAGLAHPELARVPLEQLEENTREQWEPGSPPLTIAEAKKQLAAFFGVDPSNIKITVEG